MNVIPTAFRGYKKCNALTIKCSTTVSVAYSTESENEHGQSQNTLGNLNTPLKTGSREYLSKNSQKFKVLYVFYCSVYQVNAS